MIKLFNPANSVLFLTTETAGLQRSRQNVLIAFSKTPPNSVFVITRT